MRIMIGVEDKYQDVIIICVEDWCEDHNMCIG